MYGCYEQAAGGRGYRIAEAPDVDKIISDKTKPETLKSLVSEVETAGQVNAIVITLRSTDCEIRRVSPPAAPSDLSIFLTSVF